MKKNEKRCNKCGEIKKRSEFNKDKSKKDGLTLWCKKCQKAYFRQYYQKNYKQLRKKHDQYHKENYEQICEYQQPQTQVVDMPYPSPKKDNIEQDSRGQPGQSGNRDCPFR